MEVCEPDNRLQCLAEEAEEGVQAAERPRWHCVRRGSLLPTGWDEELIALQQRDEASRSRVCAAEAESMATALSRSPLHVCGGRLHAFEKLLVARYIDGKHMI